MNLKSVSLINAVMFDGQASMQISATYGAVLELNDAGSFITARANPSKKRDPVVIPMTNIKSFVPIDPEKELAAELEAEERFRAAATVVPKSARPPTAKGIEKLVKNEKGEIVSVFI